MFNAQKLLGYVLKGAVGGQLGGSRRRSRRSISGLPRGLETQVGMGLIALAVAAYEHFTHANGPATIPANQISPPPPAGLPPPPPGVRENTQALHLLQAMIAAANADGAIDADERHAIVGRAGEAGLDAAEIAALDAQFATPLSLPQLLARTTPDLREETYVAALLGMTADTDAETQFLSQLSEGLHLDAAAQARIRSQLGLN